MICGLKARNEGVLAFSEEDEPCCHARGLITSSLGISSTVGRGNYERQSREGRRGEMKRRRRSRGWRIVAFLRISYSGYYENTNFSV